MPEPAVKVRNAHGRHQVVLVCEHASAFIPAVFNNLGLDGEAATSHIAWDPGAVMTARLLSEKLDAVLVEGTVSRLVYDCNRPPEAPGAMAARSEIYDIPGNTGLTDVQKKDRVDSVYKPFTQALAGVLANHHVEPVLVTVHSFTPVYQGVVRDLDIGILHDSDSTLADAMLSIPSPWNTQRNEPYGPQDGVTHTLKLHGIANSIANVMIEIRNTLISNPAECEAVATRFEKWLTDSLKLLHKSTDQQAAATEIRT